LGAYSRYTTLRMWWILYTRRISCFLERIVISLLSCSARSLSGNKSSFPKLSAKLLFRKPLASFFPRDVVGSTVQCTTLWSLSSSEIFVVHSASVCNSSFPSNSLVHWSCLQPLHSRSTSVSATPKPCPEDSAYFPFSNHLHHSLPATDHPSRASRLDSWSPSRTHRSDRPPLVIRCLDVHLLTVPPHLELHPSSLRFLEIRRLLLG